MYVAMHNKQTRLCMYLYMCNIFTPHIKGSNCGSYITDVSQLAVLHNWCTTLAGSQHIHTIPTGIHYQQLWNVIIIPVIVLYFWIFEVILVFL